MALRSTISLAFALLLFTGSVAAFACDAYCAPAPETPARAAPGSRHSAHAHHHGVTASGSAKGDGLVLTGRPAHPPQCSMSAETPRRPRLVRRPNDDGTVPQTAPRHEPRLVTATESSAIAPSPPISPPPPHTLPLRI